MHDLETELEGQLTPIISDGDLLRAENILSQRLASLASSPFQVALSLSITNRPEEIAVQFDDFFEHESDRFSVAAAYAEMNDFSINPEAWFFDLFAFARYGGPGNADHWLADWQSEPYAPILITGLEPLQEVYGSDAWHNSAFTDAADLAGLLVTVKFQDLIRRAGQQMQRLHFPLLATAHDGVLVYEFRRAA